MRFAIACVFVSCVLAPLAAGCGTPDPIVPSEPGRGAPPAACEPTKYPCGPYGFSVGDTIDDLSFFGRLAPAMPSDPTVIHLSDLRSGGTKAIAIFACAEWCVPCNQEQPQLLTMWNDYQAAGAKVEFLDALLQDLKSAPPDPKVADRWASKFKLPYPTVVDPTLSLGAYFAEPAFPMQMLVRASDMTILWVDAGADPVAAKAQIDAALAAP